MRVNTKFCSCSPLDLTTEPDDHSVDVRLLFYGIYLRRAAILSTTCGLCLCIDYCVQAGKSYFVLYQLPVNIFDSKKPQYESAVESVLIKRTSGVWSGRLDLRSLRVWSGPVYMLRSRCFCLAGYGPVRLLFGVVCSVMVRFGTIAWMFETTGRASTRLQLYFYYHRMKFLQDSRKRTSVEV